MTTGAGLLVAAALVHAAIAMYIATRRQLDPSRRLLGVSIATTVPGVGAALALVSVRVRGAGGSPALTPLERTAVPDRGEYERLLAEQAPMLYRLTGSRAQRMSALAELARDRDPDAVATLRWIIERGEQDAVIDAALTLEQMTEARMSEISAARRLVADATAEQLERSGNRIADMIESGLADATVTSRMAKMAREFYGAAEARQSRLLAPLATRWARLELAAADPAAALAILDRVVDPADGATVADEIMRIREDAMFAARADDPSAARR